jgi:hypothetical protein
MFAVLFNHLNFLIMKRLFLILLLLKIGNIIGQACLGGGQQLPIVTRNFGTGIANPGPNINTLTVGYTFNNTTLSFPDGEYSVRNIVPVHGLWVTGGRASDLNPNNYFALFNAQLNPGQIFYREDISNVCPNVNYEFSALMTSFMLPGSTGGVTHIEPNVTFVIRALPSNNIIKTHNTGNIANMTVMNWLRHSTTFSIPTGITSIRIEMINTASGGMGNDIAIDDITLSPAVTNSRAHFYTIQSQKTATQAISSSITLNATTPSPAVPNISYQWEVSTNGGSSWTDINGATTVPYTFNTPNSPGTYTYRLKFASGSNINSPNCRYTTDCITLTLNDPCDEFCFWKLTGNNISGNRNVLGTLTNHPIRVQTQGVERMRITEGGITRITANNTTNTNHYLQLGRINSNDNFGIISSAGQDVGTGLKFETCADNITNGGNVKMTILNNGNVGIGTQNPINAKLEIDGMTRIIANNSNNNNAGRYLQLGAYSLLDKFGYVSSAAQLPGTGLKFETTVDDNSVSGVTRMTILSSSGNVGIGTTNPLNRTEINSQNMTNPTTASAGIDNGISGLRFTNLTNTSPYYENDTFKPRGVLSVDEEGDVIWIRGGGNSGGINSTCTAEGIIPRVDINGNTNLECSQIYDDGLGGPLGGGVGIDYVGPFGFTGLGAWLFSGGTPIPTDYKLVVNGAIEATIVVATSDEKAKTKIEKIENASDKIKLLNGKSYYWNEETMKESKVGNTKQLGFLAQEVEKVLPEAVVKRKDGKYGLQYNAFIPVLVESQKEIIKENEALKSEIASLKSDNELMKEKFALLEKTITQLCESGCEGLKKTGEGSSSEVDVLYQSIPNPTDSEALINYTLSKEYANAYITVSTQEGKKLMTVKLDTKKGAGSIKISLGELANGTYLYTLVAGERVVDTKRIQIVK